MCLRVGVNPLFFKRNFQSLCCVRSHGRFYLSLFTRDNSKMKAPLSVFNWILPFLMASAICSQKREPSPPKTQLQRPRPRASTLLARSRGGNFLAAPSWVFAATKVVEKLWGTATGKTEGFSWRSELARIILLVLQSLQQSLASPLLTIYDKAIGWVFLAESWSDRPAAAILSGASAKNTRLLNNCKVGSRPKRLTELSLGQRMGKNKKNPLRESKVQLLLNRRSECEMHFILFVWPNKEETFAADVYVIVAVTVSAKRRVILWL